LARHPDSEFLMFGDSALIEAQLANIRLEEGPRVTHTDVTVSMHDKPSQRCAAAARTRRCGLRSTRKKG